MRLEFEGKLIISLNTNKTFISYVIDKELLSMAGIERQQIARQTTSGRNEKHTSWRNGRYFLEVR